jgi:hypothetical protein
VFFLYSTGWDNIYSPLDGQGSFRYNVGWLFFSHQKVTGNVSMSKKTPTARVAQIDTKGTLLWVTIFFLALAILLVTFGCVNIDKSVHIYAKGDVSSHVTSASATDADADTKAFFDLGLIP